jgi:hypothetical protein
MKNNIGNDKGRILYSQSIKIVSFFTDYNVFSKYRREINALRRELKTLKSGSRSWDAAAEPLSPSLRKSVGKEASYENFPPEAVKMIEIQREEIQKLRDQLQLFQGLMNLQEHLNFFFFSLASFSSNDILSLGSRVTANCSSTSFLKSIKCINS